MLLKCMKVVAVCVGPSQVTIPTSGDRSFLIHGSLLLFQRQMAHQYHSPRYQSNTSNVRLVLNTYQQLSNTCATHVNGDVNWTNDKLHSALGNNCRQVHICKPWWRDVKAGGTGAGGCAYGGPGVEHDDVVTGRRVWHGRPSYKMILPDGLRPARVCQRPDNTLCTFGHDCRALRAAKQTTLKNCMAALRRC